MNQNNDCGKGDAPRSCFSEQFRANYDAIDWSRGRPAPKPAPPDTGGMLLRDYKAIPSYVIPSWEALRSDLGKGT